MRTSTLARLKLQVMASTGTISEPTAKKAVPNENGTNVKQKKINGTYYCLREDGAVQTGWVCVTGDESDSIEDYRLVDADGKSPHRLVFCRAAGISGGALRS